MKRSVFILSLLVSTFYFHRAVHGLLCYSCQGGPLTNCANVTAIGENEECSGLNAQCYEAYVSYQNGALILIQRRCWRPPAGSNQTDFCKSFDNPNGKLGKCITCKTDLCNTDRNFWL